MLSTIELSDICTIDLTLIISPRKKLGIRVPPISIQIHLQLLKHISTVCWLWIASVWLSTRIRVIGLNQTEPDIGLYDWVKWWYHEWSWSVNISSSSCASPWNMLLMSLNTSSSLTLSVGDVTAPLVTTVPLQCASNASWDSHNVTINRLFSPQIGLRISIKYTNGEKQRATN